MSSRLAGLMPLSGPSRGTLGAPIRASTSTSSLSDKISTTRSASTRAPSRLSPDRGVAWIADDECPDLPAGDRSWQRRGAVHGSELTCERQLYRERLVAAAVGRRYR